MKASREHISLSPFSHTKIFRRSDAQGFSYRYHSHPEYEWVYAETPGMELFLGESVHALAQGDLVVIDGDVSHTFVSPEGKPSSACCIQFSKEAFVGFDPDHWNVLSKKNAAGLVFRGAHWPTVIAAFKRAVDLWQESETPPQAMGVKGALLTMLGELATMTPRMVVPKTGVRPKTAKGRNRVARMMDFIHNRALSPLTLHEVAGEVGLGPEPFCRFFKKHVGQTFTHYVNEVRLSQAARLLSGTTHKVLDVAIEVGYPNLSYFNRRFKDRFGLTPRAYRNKHRIREP